LFPPRQAVVEAGQGPGVFFAHALQLVGIDAGSPQDRRGDLARFNLFPKNAAREVRVGHQQPTFPVARFVGPSRNRKMSVIVGE
jgi:hypothetical protein